MIDANTNRASEGLRVLEDIARFSLDHQPLCQQIKQLRHQLRAENQALGLSQSDLLASRNTSGDVGTDISTPAEFDRNAGMVDLISAASKRAQEALRVIEESAKVLGHSGAAFERIRYALYDIERDLSLAFAKPASNWSVCVLLTKSLCLHRSVEQVIDDVAKGGAGCIQIREKDMTGAEFFDHALKMTRIAHDLGLCVILNDRVDIAHGVDADGVHLGQQDVPIAAARSILGSAKLIGRSCSTIPQLHEAFAQGVDYCGLGPVFASTTKHKPHLCGIETLQKVMLDGGLRSKPMLAISGISQDNIGQISDTGFPGVAVSGAVCSSVEPEESCRLIVESMARLAGSH